MTVHRVGRDLTLFSFLCDGCGLRWRRHLWEGPPPGWRRYRAGDDQADLCRECQAIGVWIDHPEAGRPDASWNPDPALRGGKTAALEGYAMREIQNRKRVLTILGRPPKMLRDGIICPVCRHLNHDGYGVKSGRCRTPGPCACIRAYLPPSDPLVAGMPLHDQDVRYR